MPERVEICTVGMRVFWPRGDKAGSRAKLQQKWEIVADGETSYEWRDVPTVQDEDSAGQEQG